MKKRRTLSSVVLVVLAVLLVPLALVLLVPAVSTTVAERAIRSASGLDATLESLEVDLFPPQVDGQGLVLPSSGTGFGEPAMTVDSFTLNVDAARWWDDAPTWWSGAASGVVVRAARNKAGESNWPTGQAQNHETPAAPGSKEGTPPAYRFSAVEVAGLDFYRITPGESHHLAVQDLAVNKDADERVEFALEGTWREQAVSASGSVPLPSSDRAREISVEARLPGSVVTVDGTVGHDGIVPGRAEFTIEADDLAIVEVLLDQDMTALEPVSLEGRLEAPMPGRWELMAQGDVGGKPVDIDMQLASAGLDAEDEALKIAQLRASLGDNQIQANGDVNTSAQSLTLDVNSEHLDIDQLMSLAPASQETAARETEDPLVFLGPWAMDLSLSLDEVLYQQYRAKQVEGTLQTGAGELQVDAQLARLAHSAGPRIKADKGADKLADSAARDESESERAGTGWAVTDVQVSATLSAPGQSADEGGRLLIGTLSAPGVEADLDATLAAGDLQLKSGTVELRVENFSAVTGIGLDAQDSPWQNLVPLSVNITARPHNGGWELDPLQIAASGNDLQGNLTIDPTRQPLYVAGKLQARVIDLNRIRTTSLPGKEGAEDGEAKSSGAEEPAGDGDVFSTEPIDWSWLEAATVDVGLSVDELHFNQTVFRNATLPVSLSEGVLRLDPLSAKLSEGGVRGHAIVERAPRQDGGARVDAELIITNLKPADLGMKNKGLIDGGNTDLLLNLDSRGDSPQALASNLSGEIALEVKSATIRNDVFEVIGSDLVSQTAELINPFTQRDDSTELQCAAAYFAAKDGELHSSDTLVIETSKMKIRGSGRLDLDEETLRVDFSPSAREGLGISLGDLSSVVRIGGTLSNPSVEADPSGVAKAGATIGAAVVTGGLSLLAQGLFDRARNAGGTACGKIFEKAPETEVPAQITPSM